MSRIDVQTLVLAFEKRIDALEKNPPDKISTQVIINLLEKAIEDEIKNHFVQLIEREMIKRVKKEFAEMKEEFVRKIIQNMLSSEIFREQIENYLKKKMLEGLNNTTRWG